MLSGLLFENTKITIEKVMAGVVVLFVYFKVIISVFQVL